MKKYPFSILLMLFSVTPFTLYAEEYSDVIDIGGYINISTHEHAEVIMTEGTIVSSVPVNSFVAHTVIKKNKVWNCSTPEYGTLTCLRSTEVLPEFKLGSNTNYNIVKMPFTVKEVNNVRTHYNNGDRSLQFDLSNAFGSLKTANLILKGPTEKLLNYLKNNSDNQNFTTNFDNIFGLGASEFYTQN